MRATFVVPGDPVPYERSGHKGKHHFTPERTRNHMETIRFHAADGVPGRFSGPVRLEVEFYRATERRCDIDNLVKTVADSMLPLKQKSPITGLRHATWPGIYDDDSQVVELVARKFVDKARPRTVVVICDAEGA